ncbi:MAG: AraC family transcriptional regulator, partial [Clostridiales bacterium]
IRANYLGNMLFVMAAQEMECYQQYMDKRKKKMEQQSKISEQIQLYKNITNSKTNFHDLEMQLFAKVKSCNLQEGKEILAKWQAMMFSAESDMEILKVRAIELCSLLSRAAIEGGADPKNALACNYSFLEPLNNLHKIEDISYWLNTILEFYTSSVLELPNAGHSDIIRQAIQFMSTNFSESLTVGDVADFVHMNHTYFSSIFKKATKKSFADYLQQIRIEESKLLLTTTDQSILTIAIACGFSSQSYFSKVFLKNTGCTPNQYRNQNVTTPLFKKGSD